MGGNFSEPVPTFRDTEGYVCMVLRSWDKFRVLHGNKEVLAVCQRVIGELCQDQHVAGIDKHGAVQWRLPGSPFVVNAGKESATIGKVFAIRIFEEMNHLGYDLVTSTDLSRQYDQSSWFFRKCVVERSRQPVICVAPGSYDKIIVVRGVDYVNAAIKAAIVEAWPHGIQRERPEECEREKLYEFKLHGNPWYSDGEESALCRTLLMRIIGKMAAVNWRLLGGTNLKGGTDSLFFIYDDSLAGMDRGPADLAMISLNRNDRLRLINFDKNIHNLVRTIILRFFQTKEPEERDYYGAHEFKLKGYPFHCSGEESTSTRQLICRILEALRNEGWAVKTTLDVSRKPTDKSVFIFERCESANLKFACLALSDVDHIRLLNFPQQVTTYLAKIITNGYMPGVEREFARDGACYDMRLNGSPWSYNSSFNLHARSMMTLVLKEASRYGWHLAASADVSAKYMHRDNSPDYPIDVNSWFFCYQGTSDPPILEQSDQPPPSYSELKVSDLENFGAGGGGVGGGWMHPK